VVGVCGGTSSDVDVGVVRGVAVVLVWCWCSGSVVVGGGGGGHKIKTCYGRLSLEGCHFDFYLEMGNCCTNFDSTLVVFYMLTPHSINSLTTLSVIYMHIITQSCSVSSSSNLSPNRLSQV